MGISWFVDGVHKTIAKILDAVHIAYGDS